MQGQGTQAPMSPDISSNDRLWGALSYPLPIVAILVLIMDDTKNRHFPRYHAVQALGLAAVMIILAFGLTFLSVCAAVVNNTLGNLFSCMMSFVWLAVFVLEIYFAYSAYQGKYFEIPVITDFLAKQGWLKRP